MPRWRFWDSDQPQPALPSQPSAGETRQSTAPHIRDAERRRLRRLLQRRANVEYDITQAESALLAENRWTERIAQLDEAIAQAEADLDGLIAIRRDTPDVELPPTPLEITVVQPTEPATVSIAAADQRIVYQEELDWAERGHQLALPQLQRTEGDVSSLLPSTLSGKERERFLIHLRHSFSIIANEALERTIDGQPLPAMTLADLARPCERCGGWLDPKGRCPECLEIDWKRQEIRTALRRLTDERNDVAGDLERTRDRLPVIRRQLREVEADIEQLRQKGVEPE